MPCQVLTKTLPLIHLPGENFHPTYIFQHCLTWKCLEIRCFQYATTMYDLSSGVSIYGLSLAQFHALYLLTRSPGITAAARSYGPYFEPDCGSAVHPVKLSDPQR